LASRNGHEEQTNGGNPSTHPLCVTHCNTVDMNKKCIQSIHICFWKFPKHDQQDAHATLFDDKYNTVAMFFQQPRGPHVDQWGLCLQNNRH
jgi:hypothetical protein